MKNPQDWMPIAMEATTEIVMRKRRKTTVVIMHMHLLKSRVVSPGVIDVKQTCLGPSKFQSLKFNTFQTLVSLS